MAAAVKTDASVIEIGNLLSPSAIGGTLVDVRQIALYCARVSTHPADKIDKLLPGEWKKLNAKADADLGDDTTKIVRVA